MYTYVQISLGVPWALYFVFLLLVTVPFAVMVVSSGKARGAFLRVGLPLILAAVFAVIAAFVVNSLQATELMQTEKRAGPTLLSR